MLSMQKNKMAATVAVGINTTYYVLQTTRMYYQKIMQFNVKNCTSID